MAKTDHQIAYNELSPDPHKRQIPLSTCQIKAASDQVKHDLQEVFLDTSYKYITCDNCDINAVCLYSFDVYNTNGDCLLK